MTNKISASCDRFYGVFEADPGASNNPANLKLRTCDRNKEVNTADGSHEFSSSSEDLDVTMSQSYDWEAKAFTNTDFILPPFTTEPWTRTMHIRLDEHQPNKTEPRQCLFDLDSELNLVSERTLRAMPLSFKAHPAPMIYLGPGSGNILAIGSVFLAWHMDRRKGVMYTDHFWVVPDDERLLFDVVLGKDWIRESGLLVRNRQIM